MKSKILAYPYILWSLFFILSPLFLILFYAISHKIDGNVIFTLEYFKKSFQPIYLKVLWKSFYLAISATILCLILSYPVSLILNEKSFKKRNVVLFLFVIPMWMNYLLRTYSWLNLLGPHGIINNFLALTDRFTAVFQLSPLRLNILYTDAAILIGMVYNFIPFMILPIYTVLTKIDYSLIEAAQDLGADKKTVFMKIIFPLSMPGIISGISMVFMPAVTTFVISTILGGGNYILIGNLIEKLFLSSNDWHFGSAISFVLMILILLSMSMISIFDKHKESESSGALL